MQQRRTGLGLQPYVCACMHRSTGQWYATELASRSPGRQMAAAGLGVGVWGGAIGARLFVGINQGC